MTEPNVEAAFHQAMLAIYQESVRIGYRPARFLEMVNEQGGVETARIILAQSHTTDGFTTLWEKGRLDLTVEAQLLKPEFAGLFTEEERAKARARLAEVGYTPPWDQPGPAPAAVAQPPASPAPASSSLVDRLARAVSNTQGGAAQGGEELQASPVATMVRPYDRAALERLIRQFQQHYLSFEDRHYLDEERFYKEHFAGRARELIGRERLGQLIARGDFEAAKTAIKQALSGTVVTPTGYRQQNNLLNQWDSLPIINAPAEELARRLYDLLYGDGDFDARFEAWVVLLAAKKPGVWPTATYFLMLHDPAEHLMVKPSHWQLFFKEVGLSQAWPTRPGAADYAWLRGIARQLRADLAPLGARDLVDVQAFLWRLTYRPTEAWIFTSDPSAYNLAGALAELEELRWLTPRFGDEIRAGQTVYLWEGGEHPGIVAVARVVDEPRETDTSEIETRFYHSPARLAQRAVRATLQVEQVLPRRLEAAELAAIPGLAELAVLKDGAAPIHRLSAREVEALDSLVGPEDEQDDGPEPLLGEPAFDDLVEWQRSVMTSHALTRRLVTAYPAWVAEQFGDRVYFRGLENQRFSLHVGGRRIIRGRFNQSDGVYIWLQEPPEQLITTLRDTLSQPGELRTRDRKGARGWRFMVYTDDDYGALRLATEAMAAHVEGARDATPPPDPLDGPAFVVTHAQDYGPQRLGASYAFTRKAGGSPVQLLAAVQAWQNGGPPVYLVIYRPGPHYTFSGWARVTTFREGRYHDTDEAQYVLEYQWYPFPFPVSARAMQQALPWLNKGLAIAFRGISIRPASPDDVRAVAERAYPTNTMTMTIADAAYAVLTRAGGGPLHLTAILDSIQAEGLAELRGQTPQLSLASIMLRDERFHNLGKNTWVLAAVEPGGGGISPDPDLPDDENEPPTREPAIYADEDVRYWRIHFPRGLWPAARRYGVIGIGWEIDDNAPSVKKFQRIVPGDRIIAYIQGGKVGGVGIVTRALDADNPRAGVPPEVEGEEFTQCAKIAWDDALVEPGDLSEAFKHPAYRGLYNRVKNPNTVVALSRDDYVSLLRLLQIDDPGSPPTESRLPNVWAQLTPYLSLARAIESRSLDAAMLQDAARSVDPAPAEPLDADDLVTELLQLRLIEAIDTTRYRARPYVVGDDAALLRLCALAVLAPLEGAADQYLLPARAIVPRLRLAGDAQPVERFAPELGDADSVTLAGWYAEAGLVAVEGDEWQPVERAFEPLPGADPATAAYNLFLHTLLADIDGTLVADLPHVEADAALPPVEDLDVRLRELGQDLLFDSAVVRRVYRSLLAGRHVVLSGPPGTGKTELARRLPSLLWREAPRTFSRLTVALDRPPVEQIAEQRHGYAPVVVTATEDWGVRDVVGGIGPRLDGQSGALSYTIEYGVLTRVLLQHYDETGDGRRLPPLAAGFSRRDYRPATRERHRGAWLVIDEFTRAPIDAAFGSLLTTLSGGQRATLAVPTREGELREVPLPRDFRIIGTLNSFDRHFLNQLSEAMKRRFDFIDVLPPPPAYGDYEQGIALKEALRRMRDDGFAEVERTGEGPTFRWPGRLRAEPVEDEHGLRRYRSHAEAPEAEAALDSFWRLFSAIRVFRQLGTAQVVAVYLNLLTGARVGMPWPEALDTALADGLADQLQVLSRDEQRTVDAMIEHAGQPGEFALAVKTIVRELPPGRRAGYLYALRERDAAVYDQSDIAVREDATLTDAQIARVFAVATPLAIPRMGVFRRRLRDLIGERGL